MSSTHGDIGTGSDGGNLPVKKISRKSHRKSRNGCDNCKKRKIKCDERKPQCTNCERHTSQCSYSVNIARPQHSPTALAPSPQISTPTAAGDTPASSVHDPMLLVSPSQDHLSLNIMDLELLHHFDISTSYTLSNVPALQTFFRVVVPQIGFQYPFLLHGALALSSLHLTKFKQGDAHARYLNQAHYHYETALRAATSLLPLINSETAVPLYLFGSLCSLITLGLGPKAGDFLLFGNEGVVEWLLLFRGMRSIIDMNYEGLRHSELAPMFQIAIQNIHNERSANIEHLNELREMIAETAKADPDLEMYLFSLDALAKSFPAEAAPGTRATQASPQVTFVWFYRVSDTFVQRLQERRPLALLILSYFCVVLNDLSSFWWMKGWAQHLMGEIYSCINKDFQIWLRWPMSEIGWIPA
ncbi:C6 zinc finger protein [Tricladium varicosporioides]|nr:C6 zinc finger protein [Hymenoscyphus varicosporioides]